MSKPTQSKLYIAVLDEFPDYMTPPLVAHATLRHHLHFSGNKEWNDYILMSFKKVVVRVNQKEYNKILSSCPYTIETCENNTLNGKQACITWLYNGVGDIPNVIKYAKCWSPEKDIQQAPKQ